LKSNQYMDVWKR